jgi:hypothetical protein
LDYDHQVDHAHPLKLELTPPRLCLFENDGILQQLGISIEIGRIKNINKNPVAEKAIAELEGELIRQVSNGGPVTELGLAITFSRLNARLCRKGISAHELWTQRNQFTHWKTGTLSSTNTRSVKGTIHTAKGRKTPKRLAKVLHKYMSEISYIYPLNTARFSHETATWLCL